MSDAIAGLRTRIAALLHQAGSAVREPALAGAEWDEEVARLRRAQAVRETARRRGEASLPGEEVAPGVRCVRTLEPLAPPPSHDPAAASEPADGDGTPLLFIDTETTGLAGGTGTLVFLLGVARYVDEGLLTEQWLLTRPSSEGAWIDAWQAGLPPAATLVSYNGKAFDVPLLATRQCLLRRRDRFAACAHRDLLHEVRRAFGSRWSDCRLQTAERRLLGRERFDDLAGAFAPAAFTAFVRHGAIDTLVEVIRHNREDVVSLARLLPVLDAVRSDPGRYDAAAAVIARWWLRRGDASTAERILRDCGHEPAARRALAALLRRRRDYAGAQALLEPLAAAAHPDPLALEALAKIAEHARGDAHGALRLAERLVELQPQVDRHRRRIERLRRRCAAPSPRAPSSASGGEGE